jgi:hypothetical protein
MPGGGVIRKPVGPRENAKERAFLAPRVTRRLRSLPTRQLRGVDWTENIGWHLGHGGKLHRGAMSGLIVFRHASHIDAVGNDNDVAREVAA